MSENENRKDQENRQFVVVDRQEFDESSIKVLADTRTGEQYVLASEEESVSMTPLLDEEGKQVVSDIKDKKDEN